jgi:hypothetical protein
MPVDLVGLVRGLLVAKEEADGAKEGETNSCKVTKGRNI